MALSGTCVIIRHKTQKQTRAHARTHRGVGPAGVAELEGAVVEVVAAEAAGVRADGHLPAGVPLLGVEGPQLWSLLSLWWWLWLCHGGGVGGVRAFGCECARIAPQVTIHMCVSCLGGVNMHLGIYIKDDVQCSAGAGWRRGVWTGPPPWSRRPRPIVVCGV